MVSFSAGGKVCPFLGCISPKRGIVGGSRQWKHIKFQKHTAVNNSGLGIIIWKLHHKAIGYFQEKLRHQLGAGG